MATPFILPRQGQSVESCIITKWHKQAGDTVTAGDLLFSYETDKAAFDEESTVSGTFLTAFFDEGDDVPCLLNVCVVGDPGEDFETFRPSEAGTNDSAPATASPSAAPTEAAPIAPTAPTASASASGPLFASPRAKAAAARMHLDIAQAVPTGPNGRVIERDVLAIDRFAEPAESASAITAEAAPAAATSVFTDVKITGVRKAIAKNMMASLQHSAQLTHHTSFDASDVLAWRAKLKHKREDLDLPKISINDIVLYAVARTLKSHADLNAHYLDDQGVIRQFAAVHLGMAVDTERGLLVPTIRNADRLSLAEIACEAKRLAKAAQSGSLSPDEMSGATFTISNLGSFGIEMFTPVINPPQTGILGVCNITQRAREGHDDDLEFYPAMGLSLTYDHRALDGAPASRFLKELVSNLENFTLLLAK